MNIHEHQAKEILRKFGAPVPNGVVILNLKEISEKVKKLNTKKVNSQSTDSCREVEEKQEE